MYIILISVCIKDETVFVKICSKYPILLTVLKSESTESNSSPISANYTLPGSQSSNSTTNNEKSE